MLKTLCGNERYANSLELMRVAPSLLTTEADDSPSLQANMARPQWEQMRDVGRTEELYLLAVDDPALQWRLARTMAPAGRVGMSTLFSRSRRRLVTLIDLALTLSPLIISAITQSQQMSGWSSRSVTAHLLISPGTSDLICGSHKGRLAGFAGALGGTIIEEFFTLTNRTLWRVTVSSG